MIPECPFTPVTCVHTETFSASLNNFSASKFCRERKKCKSFEAITRLYGELWRTSKFQVEKQFLIDLSLANECSLAAVNAHKFSPPCRSGNDVCQQPESINDDKPLEFPPGSFLKVYHGENQRNSEICRERTLGHTCSLLDTMDGLSNPPG